MNKILFRCDSSRHKGTGHVTRSLALAEVFAFNGWEVTFSGEFEEPKWILDFLKKIKNIIIEKPTKTIQQNKDFEVVVLDSYDIETVEVEEFSKLGRFILYIVDDISARIKADIYVSTLPAQYLPQFSDVSKCLFGPEFALIRKEIILNNKFRLSTGSSEKKTLGLFTGGSAKIEFLEIILNQIIPQLNGWNIKIFSDSIDLNNVDKQNINLEFVAPRPDFYNELNGLNLVISPASVSSWEFINMELPLAVYGIYQNQKSAYEFIVNGGYAEGLGFVENYKVFKLNEDNLKIAMDKSSKKKLSQKRNKKTIDGNGSNRIYEEVVKMISS
jgi:spore coat polysaccharide biosynthesis predicted glycosyltransferase SpsG